MRFFCIDDNVPVSTIQVLRRACERRGIAFVHLHAGRFDPEAQDLPGPGDLLYRPAISAAAQRLEQMIAVPGVATFHADPEGMHFPATNPGLIHQTIGLPVPRSFQCQGGPRDQLMAQAEACGGFPVVLKVPGNSRGIGVMRADSPEALVSLVDFALSTGRVPVLMPWIADAVHWRVVVVGDRAVAAYRNPQDAHDFRTYGSNDPADFTADVPAPLADLAVRAVAALRLELGGVDILAHVSGRLYLLESNFPLYHAHAEEVAGIDVSGAMVEHLAGKARRMAGAEALPPAVRLAEAPVLWRIDGFASAEECEHVLRLIDDDAWLAAAGITLRRDATGTSCELPLASDTVLARLARRMEAATGLANHFGATLRMRRYDVGQGHPPHGDIYEIDGMRLEATALLYLTDAEGGETAFDAAQPAPADLRPVRGRLAWWRNYLQDGRPDPAARHLARPVTAGVKVVLGQFFYLPPGAA